MNNAYMIRQDGKLIPVTVHIYGSTDDPEATGQSNAYLRHGSEVINHMSTDDFINLSGRPVLDKRTVDVTDVLPNMNATRRHERLLHLHAKDSAFSKVWSKT